MARAFDDSEVAPLDMMKLWKGLFYCMWMSDKMRIQQMLAEDIAALGLLFSSNALTLLYFQCFWKTMMREWHGIDYHRLDKFYFLCKKVIQYSLEWLQREGYEGLFLDAYCNAMQQEVLSEKCLENAPSVTYYYCEKLLSVIVQEYITMDNSVLKVLLKPVFMLMYKSSNKLLTKKITESLVEPIERGYLEDEEDREQMAFINKDSIMRLKKRCSKLV